ALTPLEVYERTSSNKLITEEELQQQIMQRIEKVLGSLTESHMIARKKIKQAQAYQKRYHDNNHKLESYEIGDKVLLQRSEIQHSKSAKLEVQCSGPYYIHNVLGNRTYKLRTITRSEVLKKAIHGNRLKLYHPRPGYHYYLGISLEAHFWNEGARKEVRKHFRPRKYHEIWKTTYRVYQLYSIRGLGNLLSSQHITPFVLFRMYDEDFSMLLEEARSIRNSEIDDLLGS
ncbi:2469_t:CDS:2, partial [Racocetra fulgida]